MARLRPRNASLCLDYRAIGAIECGMGHIPFRRWGRTAGRRLVIGLLIFFAVVVVLSLALYLSGPQFIQVWAAKQLEDQLGRQVEIGGARLALLPQPRIRIENLIVHERGSDDVLLQAERVIVVLHLQPLMHLAVVPSRLKIERPRLALRRAPGGQWNILPSGSDADAAHPPDLWAALGRIHTIEVSNGRVTVEDETSHIGIWRTHLTNVDLRVAVAWPDPGAVLRVTADIASGQGSSHVVVSGTLGPEERAMPGFMFKGLVDAEWVDLQQLLTFLSSSHTPVGRGRIDAAARIREARYGGHHVTDLSGQVHLGEGTMTVDDLQGRIGDGRINAQIRLQSTPGKPVDTKLTLNLARVPIEELFRAFSIAESPVIGPLDLTGTITAHGGPKTLAGKLNLRIEHGRLYQLSVLSKILGILNLPALLKGKVDFRHEGMPFDHITGTLSVDGGRIESRDLVVDSPVMKIGIAGHYDLPTDHLECIAAVSPLGSYFDVLLKIPLFGKVLADDRGDFVSAVFRVKGPLKDPDVSYSPVRTLTHDVGGLIQRALDVLKQTILLPTGAN